MQLRNTNPLGAVDLPLIGRVLEPGETFEIDDERGNALLEQVGNYELVREPKAPTAKAKGRAAAAAARKAGQDTDPTDEPSGDVESDDTVKGEAQ